jgi:hypothetical protein
MNIYSEELKNNYHNLFNKLLELNKLKDKNTDVYVVQRLYLYINEINITDGMVNIKKIYLKMNDFILNNFEIVSEFDDNWHIVYLTKTINEIDRWYIFSKLVIKYIKKLEDYIGNEKTHDIILEIQEKSINNEFDNSDYIYKQITKIIDNINNLNNLYNF